MFPVQTGKRGEISVKILCVIACVKKESAKYWEGKIFLTMWGERRCVAEERRRRKTARRRGGAAGIAGKITRTCRIASSFPQTAGEYSAAAGQKVPQFDRISSRDPLEISPQPAAEPPKILPQQAGKTALKSCADRPKTCKNSSKSPCGGGKIRTGSHLQTRLKCSKNHRKKGKAPLTAGLF